MDFMEDIHFFQTGVHAFPIQILQIHLTFQVPKVFFLRKLI